MADMPFIISVTVALVFSAAVATVFHHYSAVAAQTNSTSSNTTVQYSYHLKWGSMGSENGQFLSPHGVGVDSAGNLYVTDRDRNDIQKFTSDGVFIKKWGSKGDGPGEFDHPYEIEIDTSDNLYVVDKNNNRIQIFDIDGNFIDSFEVAGGSDVSFNLPEALALDPKNGFIYLIDTGNNRVVKLSHTYEFIDEWGEQGTGDGDFEHPHGADVDSSGNFYVNEINPPIQKFDSNGRFIKLWGSPGNGPGQFAPHLEHLFVDSQDNVWQVDGEENSRLVKFDNDGNFIMNVGSGPCVIEDTVKTDKVKMAGPLPCDGKLNAPEHATADASGNLYVVDRGNQRIVVFAPDY